MTLAVGNFSHNELLKPLFYLFTGVPGGTAFRREMQQGITKEGKTLRQAVTDALKAIPSEFVYQKDKGDIEKIHSYEASSESTM